MSLPRVLQCLWDTGFGSRNGYPRDGVKREGQRSPLDLTRKVSRTFSKEKNRVDKVLELEGFLDL